MIGPRQSGKSTLVKKLFPEKPYVNLEALDRRDLAQSDPRGFLAQYPDGAILDEIQRVPELLSYIQELVDERDAEKKRGIYILTGSHQLSLHANISQSLAGRTAILKLLPLSLSELKMRSQKMQTDDFLYMGFYPRIYRDNIKPTDFYRDYVQTYIERDVRQLIQIKNLGLFKKFIQLCAGRVGQILNANSLANEVGVSNHTINEWLSILEASFVLIRVQPYFENFGKRVIKSPKIYFTDVGLLTYLLGIHHKEQLIRDPLRGQLFENLVVVELMKAKLNAGEEANFYYYRDTTMNEVDLVYKQGSRFIAIEIKSAQTFSRSFLKGLRYFQKIVQERFAKGYVIYSGDQEQQVETYQLINYRHCYNIWNN